MKSTVLITGGLGYVGGRVVSFLTEYPELNLLIGTHRRNIAKPLWLKKGKLKVLDLSSPENLFKDCQDIDVIIHLAALNENDSAANPAQALKINSLGTLRLLMAAEKAGVKRFIYFSTAHIYGAPLYGKINELTLPKPVHPYAITHRTAEDFVLAAHNQAKLTGIVVRLSNGFGVPMDSNVNRWTLIVNDLCRQAVTTGKLELRSSGLQKRDFITLTDICRATKHFIDMPSTDCDNGLFNLGGECSLTIYNLSVQIAQRCREILGFTPPIIRPEPGLDESSNMLEYNIDKLKATGFSLTGDINQEIDRTLLLCQQAFGGDVEIK